MTNLQVRYMTELAGQLRRADDALGRAEDGLEGHAEEATPLQYVERQLELAHDKVGMALAILKKLCDGDEVLACEIGI